MPFQIRYPNRTGVDSLILGAGHSLIIGHGPALTALEKLEMSEKEAKERIENFGLFNISSPSNNNYYQDVKPEDLHPKEGDFIRPIFRGLSEVIVRKSFDPIDFSMNGVLKASINKIKGQSVYTNHEVFVGNEVGAVSNSFWDNAYEWNGVKIPAGMNLEFLIDGKSHPKIARGINAPTPSIHSNSVNVRFAWEQSHPKMRFEDFRGKVGTFGSDGQLIRRIASDIQAYGESSLVSHGADPYAQKVNKDGKIINPNYAKVADNSFSAQTKSRNYYFYDYKDQQTLSAEVTIPSNSNITDNEESSETQNKFPMKKSTILALAAVLGIQLPDAQKNIADDKFSEDFNFEEFFSSVEGKEADLTALSGNAQKIVTLEAEKATLTTQLADATKFKTDNEAKLKDVVSVEKFTDERRKELVKVAKLVLGDQFNATLETSYLSGTLEATEAQLKTYNTQLDAKFPQKCGKCGSTELARASVEITDPGKGDAKLSTTEELRQQVRDAARKNGINQLFGGEKKKEEAK